jgi:hypothetical protein
LPSPSSCRTTLPPPPSPPDHGCHWKVLGGHLLTCLQPTHHHHMPPGVVSPPPLSYVCFTMVDPHDIVFGKSIVHKMSAHILLTNSPLIVTFCAGIPN